MSGHSVHPDPEKNLMELDPRKFAISPSLTLVSQLGGAFHAASCRKLLSIKEAFCLAQASRKIAVQGMKTEDFTATTASLLHGTRGTPLHNTGFPEEDIGECHWPCSMSPRQTSSDKEEGSQTAATSL